MRRHTKSRTIYSMQNNLNALFAYINRPTRLRTASTSSIALVYVSFSLRSFQQRCSCPTYRNSMQLSSTLLAIVAAVGVALATPTTASSGKTQLPGVICQENGLLGIGCNAPGFACNGCPGVPDLGVDTWTCTPVTANLIPGLPILTFNANVSIPDSIHME